MPEIPVEVEIATEQAWGCNIGEVEQGCGGHEQGQHEREAARGNKTRTGQGRHRDHEEETRELGGGPPLDGQTVRQRAVRRQKKGGEQYYAKDRRQRLSRLRAR